MKNWMTAKVIAVLRHDDFTQAFQAGRTALQNGIDILEATFTTPNASELITQFKKEFPEKTIGAGSITTLEQAKLAQKSGADFFVSPHFDRALSDWFLENKLPYVPGGMTPTELKQIQLQGHEYQKLFPAMILGPQGVKNILAPLPELKLILTGGVELTNASSYLEAGAKAICVGGALFSKRFMDPQNQSLLANECQKWAKI